MVSVVSSVLVRCSKSDTITTVIPALVRVIMVTAISDISCFYDSGVVTAVLVIKVAVISVVNEISLVDPAISTYIYTDISSCLTAVEALPAYFYTAPLVTSVAR